MLEFHFYLDTKAYLYNTILYRSVQNYNYRIFRVHNQQICVKSYDQSMFSTHSMI